ncbi:DUF4148 domain-containing protein [Alcaligenes sp. SDU_A2]|uniref:DUF4148 domain-containing protein n=1 Tax=Alcaligenes sp. SDU_A2 TaxID=3136634 RepID=UPI002CC4E965|nr:DUF4148 domain-containing protein [Alcaligenes faecalis]HRL20298.1 DUF4148 domain-containing protein [Alcaligenes sp.]
MKSIARTAILGLSLSAATLMGVANAASIQQAQQSIGELNYPPAITETSTLSRQEVLQELAQARAQGQIQAGAMNDYPQLPQASQLSREQVIASTQEWNSMHGDFVTF